MSETSRSNISKLNGFFTLLELDAADVSHYADSFEQMREGTLQGIMVHNVYPSEVLDTIVCRLEQHQPAFLKTWFPDAFKSWFYGQNLNLADPELNEYFAQAEQFHQHLKQLFAEYGCPINHITNLMSALDTGRTFCAAPGPNTTQHYMFSTIRGHEQGGFIPPHCENEYPRRSSYHHLRSIADAHVYSYVLAFTLPDAGGALEIFDHKAIIADSKETSTKQSDTFIDIDQLNSVQVRIPPGSMMLFDSGAYLHQLRPIESSQRRWTMSSFMAMSQDTDDMYCWG